MMSDCSNFAENQDQLNKFRLSYSWKIKLHSIKGGAIYNCDSDSFDEITGDLDATDAKKLIFGLLNQPSSKVPTDEISHSEVNRGREEDVFTESEIKDLEAKLSTLGYS